MKKFSFLSVVLVVLVFSSCKKDDAPNPNPGNSSKLLTKLTKTENGVATIFNLVYDGSKRLSSYKSTDNKVGIIFSYDANGNVTKVEDTEDDFKNIYTYAYTNGLPVSGTFKSWQKSAGNPDALIEDDALTYTLTNNQVSKIHVYFGIAGDAMDFNLTYGADGNLSKIVSAAGDSYKATFTYGNKKPVFPVVSKYVLDQAGFSLQFAAKNEILSVGYDFPGTQFDETINTQYTYDANGYVLTSSDGTAFIKFEYQ